MTKVIIVCIQGVTSSVMAKKLNILAKQKNENYEFQAVSVADIHDYLDESDYVLLTPQVKSKFNDAILATKIIPPNKIEIKAINTITLFDLFIIFHLVLTFFSLYLKVLILLI